MRKIIAFIALAISFGAVAPAADLTRYVNTFQGSHNTPEFSHGRLSPVTVLPHRMAAWSPSGFNFVEGRVSGLSCMGLSFIPEGGGSFVASASEGKPEYLKIKLGDGMTMDATPAGNGGIISFTPAKKKEVGLALRGSDLQITAIDGKGKTAEGFVVNKSGHHLIQDTVWFKLSFDQPFVKEGDTKLSFPSVKKVTVKAAFSKIGPEQAVLNFIRELDGKSFDTVRTDAKGLWDEALGRITVEGGTLEQRRTFYSCLFRTMLRPALDYEYDVSGNPHFRFNGTLYDGKYHSNPILWDAFRCLFALNNIIDKDLQEEYLPSLVRTQDLLGWWPNGHVMIGNHAISVLCDAWAKGIRCFDPEDVLGRYVSEITKSQLERDVNAAYNAEHLRGFGRMGFEDYFSIGYIPFPQGTNRVMETTSKTLEYNYDDFCAWKLARMAGLDFYKNVFARHIFNYRNVYDPSDGFFKGRDREGKFDEDFNPYEWGGPFVEGNGWQWRFFVPQDAAGMMSLMGGKDGFVKNLDALFAAPSDSALCGGYGFMIHEIYEAMAGKQGQYAQGNEPCFHVMHLYNYAGKPWKAQEWLRDSMERLFDSSEKGFPGDEDGGAMSAWYVFNAMGFYPVTPGVAQYSIGSPLFDKVTVSLPDGGTFTIKAEGNGPGNVYIESATLDGKEYVHNYLDHSAVVSGGTLVLKMSPKPNLTRGTSPEDAPYSMSTDK